jgi:hypothetical protein
MPHQLDRTAAADGQNTSRQRWKRSAFLVGRLRDGHRGQKLNKPTAVQVSKAPKKQLETQHWLELVDGCAL